MNEISSKEAYSRATGLCSKSEKCLSDIRKKLYDWHVDADEHNAILDRLVDNKYIDEERFAAFFVRDKFRFNHWGRVKIKYHLSQKGISSHDQALAFEEINEEEYSAGLIKALTTKNRSIRTDDIYERKQKLMRFAAGRGFTSSEINIALDDLLQ